MAKRKTLPERIRELEKRVEELEARPAPAPQCWPWPWYIPYQPPMPWWPYGTTVWNNIETSTGNVPLTFQVIS